VLVERSDSIGKEFSVDGLSRVVVNEEGVDVQSKKVLQIEVGLHKHFHVCFKDRVRQCVDIQSYEFSHQVNSRVLSFLLF